MNTPDNLGRLIRAALHAQTQPSIRAQQRARQHLLQSVRGQSTAHLYPETAQAAHSVLALFALCIQFFQFFAEDSHYDRARLRIPRLALAFSYDGIRPLSMDSMHRRGPFPVL